jgi:hypothetical protein
VCLVAREAPPPPHSTASAVKPESSRTQHFVECGRLRERQFRQNVTCSDLYLECLRVVFQPHLTEHWKGMVFWIDLLRVVEMNNS